MTCFVLKIALNCANSFGLSTGWLTKWLTPDGSAFIFKNKTEANSTNADMPSVNGRQGTTIELALNNSISHSAEKSTENAKNVM